MARDLSLKTDVDAPDGTYPFGRIRDEFGMNDGTPFDEQLYGDFHQFFAKMFENSGLTYNNLPDNAYSGFQFFDSLHENINKYKGLALYSTNTSLTSDDVGKLVTYFAFFAGATFTLPPPATDLIGKKLIIRNAVPFDLTIIQSTGFLVPVQTWTLKQWDVMELYCADVNTWNVLSVYRKLNSDIVQKIIPIGDWNMTVSGPVNIAHGLGANWDKIRSVKAVVRDDANSFYYPLEPWAYSNTSAKPGGTHYWNTINVIITRFSDAEATAMYGGVSMFDNVSFNATSYNRGYVTIEYAV